MKETVHKKICLGLSVVISGVALAAIIVFSV